MIPAIRSEFRKFFTTRMWWGMAIAMFAAAAAEKLFEQTRQITFGNADPAIANCKCQRFGRTMQLDGDHPAGPPGRRRCPTPSCPGWRCAA